MSEETSPKTPSVFDQFSLAGRHALVAGTRHLPIGADARGKIRGGVADVKLGAFWQEDNGDGDGSGRDGGRYFRLRLFVRDHGRDRAYGAELSDKHRSDRKRRENARGGDDPFEKRTEARAHRVHTRKSRTSSAGRQAQPPAI